MPTRLAIGIDHVVVLSRDLEGLRQTFERLGFAVSPEGVHIDFGTANHTIILGAHPLRSSYVELLEIRTPNVANKRFCDLLGLAEGAWGIALKACAGAQSGEVMASWGLPVQQPRRIRRSISTATGKTDAVFNISFIDGASTSGSFLFICEHETPELVWSADRVGHANGALSLMSVVIHAPRCAMNTKMLDEFVKLDSVYRSNRWSPLTGQLVEICSPDEMSWLLGVDQHERSGDCPVVAALRIRCANLQTTKSWLAKSRVRIQERNRTVVVPAREAGGVGLIFQGP